MLNKGQLFILKINKHKYFILEITLNIQYYILLCRLILYHEYFLEPIKFIESII